MFAKLESNIEVRADVEKFPMASSICAFYPASGSPYISINEVEASVADGVVESVEPVRTMNKNYDPEGSIDLIHPETGEPIGKTMSEAEIGMVLYSIWIHMRNIPEPVEIEEPVIEPELSS